MILQPKLDILPDSQKELWPQLKDVPKEFVLYGGTAVALRYGHRESVDFDFFTTEPLDLEVVSKNLSFIQKYKGVVDDGKTDQQIDYILAVGNYDRNKVQVTFMNNKNISPGSINPPDTALGPGIKIASPLDLMGCKVLTASERTEKKDFIDIVELMKHNISLQKGFEASVALARISPLGIGRLKLYNLREDLQAKTLHRILPDNPECVEALREAASKLDVDKAMKTKLKATPELYRRSGISR